MPRNLATTMSSAYLQSDSSKLVRGAHWRARGGSMHPRGCRRQWTAHDEDRRVMRQRCPLRCCPRVTQLQSTKGILKRRRTLFNRHAITLNKRVQIKLDTAAGWARAEKIERFTVNIGRLGEGQSAHTHRSLPWPSDRLSKCRDQLLK